MKTILVPTDFSDAADNAAEYAAQLAKRMNARLLLFHVYHLPVVSADVPLYIDQHQLQKENGDLLRKEAARLKKIANVEIKCVTRLGMAVDEILEEERNANFIVMGMQGANRVEEAILGSVSTAVLRKAKVPVLIIPENVKYRITEKLVFACDYMPGTDTNHLNLLKEFGSKVYIVNVNRSKASIPVNAGVEQGVETSLKGMECFYYFPEKEDLVETINDFAESKKADMIVVVPHHYTLMERLFHKSISKKLAFHTRLPLLALPDVDRRSIA